MSKTDQDPQVVYEAADPPPRPRDPIFGVAVIGIDTFNNPLPGETLEDQIVRFVHRLVPPKTKA